MTQKMDAEQKKQALWWWAGDEASARRRFRERFGIEATLVATPQPGIVALGPVPERIKTGENQGKSVAAVVGDCGPRG